MFKHFIELNWAALALGTITYSFFSGMWHRQFAFGKLWEDAMGFVRPDGWKESAIYYVIPLIACFISTTILAFFQRSLGITSASEAMILGAIVGFGFSMPTTFTNAVIPIMKKPLKFASITGAAHFFAMILVSLVVFLLSK